jgi:hypothetical protein
MRAGQRPPDRRTAYGPPPLVKSAAPSARECRKLVTQARENRRDDDHQGRRPQREMTGDGLRRDVGKSLALLGGSPPGEASRRLAAVPHIPGPVVARRYGDCNLNGSVALSVVAGCTDVSRSVMIDVTELVRTVFSAFVCVGYRGCRGRRRGDLRAPRATTARGGGIGQAAVEAWLRARPRSKRRGLIKASQGQSQGKPRANLQAGH